MPPELAVRSLLTAALITCNASCASSKLVLPPELSPDEFGSHINYLRSHYNIPGVSGIVMRTDDVVWEQQFGTRNVGSGAGVTAGTLFHIASLTKPIAAAIAMQLVQEGTLSLEQPVKDFGINLAELDTVRVKHLMSMTSAGVPGTAFYYDGNRFALLDTVLRRTTGQTFLRLFEERVRRPLSLDHTAPDPRNQQRFNVTGLDRTVFSDSMARGYGLDRRNRNHPREYETYFGTAAGLVSSPRDYAKFVRALSSNTLLNEAARARMFTPVITAAGDSLPYALGWFVQRHHNEVTYWHYGLWTGTSTLVIHVPARQLTFVLFANNEMLSAPFALGQGELLTSPFARAFFLAFLD